MTLLLVALAGAVGCVLRYGMYFLIPKTAYGFPLATFAVNVIGAILIGIVFVVIQHRFNGSEFLKAVMMIGLLGGFTTFSAFSFETVQLMYAGYFLKSLFYIISSVIVCVLSTFISIQLTRYFLNF